MRLFWHLYPEDARLIVAYAILFKGNFNLMNMIHDIQHYAIQNSYF